MNFPIKSIFTALMYAVTMEVLAQNPVMPEDLLRIAEEQHCAQINDFFKRQGPINPPYLYGFEGINKPASAIFWCKLADPKAAIPYRLIISGKPKVLGNCPNNLAWWNPPGGLSITRAQNIDFSKAHYLKDPKRSGPTTKRIVIGILSSYDGVESTFYCHNGDWLFRIKD